jgi:hypothetical protein
MIHTIRFPRRWLLLTLACSLLLLSCGQPPASRSALNVAADVTAQPVPAAESPALPAEEAPLIAGSRIPLGPGFANNFNHALVRTAEDRLYLLINNDTPARIGAGPGYLAMLRATSDGAASDFTEQDAAHRPVSGGSSIVDAGMAIDGQGMIHLLFHDRDADGQGNGQLKYIGFDTGSDTWGQAETVVAQMSDVERGYGGTAISLDQAGVPHIVYANRRQIFYRNRSGGAWSDEQQISDEVNEAQHPSIAHGPDNRVHIAWHVRDPGNAIRYRSRSADGRFDDAQSIATYQRSSLNDVDQGPMLTLTADGNVWCAYLDGDEHARVRRLAGDQWLDAGPPGDIYAHAPTIAAVNNDLWLLLGHDDQIDYALLHKPAGAPWSEKQTLEAGKFDGSANVRWSWFFNGSSPILDTLFFDEGEGSQLLATIFYRAIDTRGGVPTPVPPTATPAPEPTATPLPPPTLTPTTEPCSGLPTPFRDDFGGSHDLPTIESQPGSAHRVFAPVAASALCLND